jgi:hypothetical protein
MLPPPLGQHDQPLLGNSWRRIQEAIELTAIEDQHLTRFLGDHGCMATSAGFQKGHLTEEVPGLEMRNQRAVNEAPGLAHCVAG